MSLMATDDENRKKDRHRGKALQLRIHPLLRQQLEAYCDSEAITLTSGITMAVREFLRQHKFWPPPTADQD